SITVLAGCIAGYLAFQPPVFYADLRAQQYSASEQMAAEAFFERLERDLQRWTDRSVALQRGQLSNTSVKTPLNAWLSDYDPTQDTHSVTVTEKHVNVQLASGEVIASRHWQNPRVHMRKDCLSLAVEVVTSRATCVLSLDLKPTLTPERRLHLDLVSARIGQLPLPLRSFLRWLPREVHHVGSGMELDLTAPTPHFSLDVSDSDPESPIAKSIQCSDGEVTIEFLAPVLKPQQVDRRTAPRAVSRRN
ncbi:MAG: hypothetical protein MUF06_24580, partial [Pirellulaceae bacterium]|nr:hypothetical protein [Pirellulaceae bacterium]